MNIVFDTSYLFYKSMFAVGSFTKSRFLDKKEERELFVGKIATDAAFAIRHFAPYNKITFAFDESSSWRKQVVIEENAGYKSNRKQDESLVNWKVFYEIMEEWKQICLDAGCNVLAIKHAEADDLVALCGERNMKNGEDTVIVTADGDSYQLAQLKENNFVAIFNSHSKTRKLVVPPGFIRWLEDFQEDNSLLSLDVFNTSNKDNLNRLRSELEFAELDRVMHVLKKIIFGDGGDAVPSIYRWQKIDPKTKKPVIDEKTGEIKMVQVTNAPCMMIIDKFQKSVNKTCIESLYIDEDYRMKLVDAIIEIVKLPKYANLKKEQLEGEALETLQSELSQRIKRNIMLMYLDRLVIPPVLQEEFDKTVETDTPRIVDKNSFLKGTKYEKMKPKLDIGGIFSGLNVDESNNLNTNKLF